VQDEDAAIAAVIDAAEVKWLEYRFPLPRINQRLDFCVPSLIIIFNFACREDQPPNRGRFTGRPYGNAQILFLEYHVLLSYNCASSSNR
jgi:hypothetical protein